MTSIKSNLDLLFETHFPGSKRTDQTREEVAGHEATVNYLKGEEKSIVTKELVRKAYGKFGNHKTAGPDEIKPIVLKLLPDSTIDRIVAIYQASIRMAYMPKQWLTSTVVFIPKPGKESYNIPKSFRPISLTSFLLKGLERILGWHLEDTVLKERPLSEWQHGFKRDKNTETAILNTVDRIESAILRGGFAVGAFLDIQGAFDSLKPKCAIKALKDKHFPPWFIKWYGSFLTKRFAETTWKGTTVRRELVQGAPQGDVLSTLIWNINYDPMLNKINSETHCNTTGFADDGRILVSGPVLRTIVGRIQTAIDCALNWGRDNGMKFNAQKTEIVIFTRKYKYSTPPPILMEGKAVEYKNSAKFLGVTLDHRLNWETHTSDSLKRAKRKLMMLKTAIGKSTGPNSKLLEWAFKGVVLPGLLYAASAWVKRTDQNGLQDRMRKLNRLAMNLVAGAYKSTPTRGMELILNYPPIHLLAQNRAIRSLMKNGDKLTKVWDGVSKERGTILWTRKLNERSFDLANISDDGVREFNFYAPWKINWGKNIKHYEDMNLIQCYIYRWPKKENQHVTCVASVANVAQRVITLRLPKEIDPSTTGLLGLEALLHAAGLGAIYYRTWPILKALNN